MITDANMCEYEDKEQLLTRRKYGSSIYLPRGYSIYLPQKGGDGITDVMSNIAQFVGNNKDVINAGLDTASKVAKLGIDISKGVEEVKNLKAMRQRKEGSGLYPEYSLSDLGSSVTRSTGAKKKNKQQKTLVEKIASGSGFEILTQYV